jgi:hypothetical protein
MSTEHSTTNADQKGGKVIHLGFGARITNEEQPEEISQEDFQQELN